jgi:hypothetical protein
MLVKLVLLLMDGQMSYRQMSCRHLMSLLMSRRHLNHRYRQMSQMSCRQHLNRLQE